MKNFTDIITNRYIDCHTHVFDVHGCTPLNNNIKKIGFMDIWFKELDKYTGSQSEELYNNYIKEGIPSGVKLLATAPDPDQIIHIYEKHIPYIKGFGELKCYDYSFANDIPEKLEFKDLKWVYELCDYVYEKLPVYIHYSLDINNYNQLESLFKNYPNIPFILCHCGIGTIDEYGFSLDGDSFSSFKLACQLAKLHNVYLEISYTAANWIYGLEPQDLYALLYQIHPSKFLLGTDVNNVQFLKDFDKGCEKYKYQEKIFLHLYKYFGQWNYINYRKLFE